MDYLELQKYYNQYVSAVIELNRARQRVNLMKQPVSLSDGRVICADREDIAAAEAEIAALAEKVDNLYCLSTCGKAQAEVQQAETYKPIGIQPSGHWPGQ